MRALLDWMNPAKWLGVAIMFAALVVGYNLWAAHLEGVGYKKAEAVYTAAALKAEQVNRAREQSLQMQVTKAQHDYQDRQTILLADAAASRSAADSLRNQIAANSAKLSTLTRDAVDQYARAAGLVLTECQRDYQGMAEKADAAVNDVVLLRQAWPK